MVNHSSGTLSAHRLNIASADSVTGTNRTGTYSFTGGSISLTDSLGIGQRIGDDGVRKVRRAGHAHFHGDGQAHEIATSFEETIAEHTCGAAPFFAEINFFETHRPFPHHGMTVPPREEVTIPRYLPDIPVIREDLATMEASAGTAIPPSL